MRRFLTAFAAAVLMLSLGTANAAALHFDDRLDVVDRQAENFDRLLAGLGLHLLKGTVDDALGDGLLAVQHDDVHELGELDAAELGIGQNLALGYFATTGHCCFLVSVQLNRVSLHGHGRPLGRPLTCRAPSCIVDGAVALPG